ncbi:MAG: hypothetical protein A3D99_03410 [Candidatus Andersenbacteria bacterium RIFCSPHIGHO2_12_FULL_45_11]|uniref:Nudix hydrolase domain-containing protein n=1 Tax=Candidatus Andersenbacteria bacterium RIFCSPHIGHO2_12_FULL_45_11 TaxID=1797281 RepID=A0A1G1X3C7_9BACT|nr:MAG: hypothetical protein A3D99_03410 [Candidatus Andersenbacteria bacterium RIFCSPHIGHO2_12_FULL_45_11]
MPVSPTTFYRTSIKALIFDEHKKILLAKDGGNNGKWDFPGGGMDWGETPHVCLAREIQEEMGIAATWIADHPSYFYSGQSDKGLWFAYAIYEARLEHLNFTLSDECVEVKFFSVEEAKNQNIFSNIAAFLELYRAERHEAV